jgi:hypothetical protein
MLVALIGNLADTKDRLRAPTGKFKKHPKCPRKPSPTDSEIEAAAHALAIQARKHDWPTNRLAKEIADVVRALIGGGE